MSRRYYFPVLLPILLVFACGKSNSDSSGDSSSTITVVGNLADWPTAVGSFTGYTVVLYNIDNGRVYRSTIGANTTGFSISDVPLSGRYNAILLDPEYRFGWILQIPGKTGSETPKYYQAFRFAGVGLLGSLSATGRVLRSSEQTDLIPYETIKFLDANNNGIPDGLEPALAGNSANTAANTTNDLDADGVKDSSDSDMDNDGIPNAFDTDIDNDGIPNWLDANTGNHPLEDKDFSWSKNPLVAAENGEIFRYVFSEAKENGATSLWLVFSAPVGRFSSVKVQSGTFLDNSTYSMGGEAFAGVLYDDGTHGDGVPNDGTWSVPITLAAGKHPNSSQEIFFRGTQSDGTTREYVVNVGGVLSGTMAFSDSTSRTVSWTASGFGTTVGYQVLVFNSTTGARVYASDLLSSTTTSHTISESDLDSGSYTYEIRVVAPTPRDGFPGSSWRPAATKSLVF